MLCWGMTGTVMMMCCAARAVAIGLADAVRRWSGAVEKRRGGGGGRVSPHVRLLLCVWYGGFPCAQQYEVSKNP